MPARDWLTRNKSINSTKSGKILLEFTILLLGMIHQSRRIGSGIVPAKCVFKINEDRRVRPLDGRPEQNTRLCKWCMKCLCICLFLFQRNSRVLFANFEIFKHFDHIWEYLIRYIRWKNFPGFFHVWNFLQINSFEFLENFLFSDDMDADECMNAWMQQSHSRIKQSTPTKVMGWIILSLISIIHFGGLWFTPYQHPSSIDIKDTWTDQPWIKGSL